MHNTNFVLPLSSNSFHTVSPSHAHTLTNTRTPFPQFFLFLPIPFPGHLDPKPLSTLPFCLGLRIHSIPYICRIEPSCPTMVSPNCTLASLLFASTPHCTSTLHLHHFTSLPPSHPTSVHFYHVPSPLSLNYYISFHHHTWLHLHSKLYILPLLISMFICTPLTTASTSQLLHTYPLHKVTLNFMLILYLFYASLSTDCFTRPHLTPSQTCLYHLIAFLFTYHMLSPRL